MNAVYETIPESLLIAANNDLVLKGFIKKDRHRVAIREGQTVVGFFQPTEIVYHGKSYWRTGNIFVLNEYRNKGLASKAILDFFSDKPFGLAWIAFDNVSSMKAFSKAGFHKVESATMKNPRGKLLYLFLKEPIAKPLFDKW